MANVNVTIRIDEHIKARADALFADLGMNFTTAVNVFVRQAIREGRIPFAVGGAAAKDPLPPVLDIEVERPDSVSARGALDPRLFGT